MQFDKDLESEFKELFLKAREILLSYEGIVETKSYPIFSISRTMKNHFKEKLLHKIAPYRLGGSETAIAIGVSKTLLFGIFSFF